MCGGREEEPNLRDVNSNHRARGGGAQSVTQTKKSTGGLNHLLGSNKKEKLHVIHNQLKLKVEFDLLAKTGDKSKWNGEIYQRWQALVNLGSVAHH